MVRFLDKIESKLLLLFFKTFEKNIHIGEGTSVRKGFYLRTTDSSNIFIGSNCFFNRNFSANTFNAITKC